MQGGQWACPNCGQVNSRAFCGQCGAARPVPGQGAQPQAGQAAAPASAGAFYSTFQTGRHYRVHKSYIWVAPIMAVFAFLVIGTLNGMQGIIQLVMAIRAGDIAVNPLFVVLAIIGGFALLVGAFIALYALAYKNMSYVFDEREFSFYSGIITKRHVHVPYARVQSVNHRASLVQRLFGVCTVSIDSAGGSANKAVRVPYLRLETAERLRVELFVRKAAVAAGQADALVYMPQADTATEEGAAREALLNQQQRGQAPVMPGAVGAPAAVQPGAHGAPAAQGPNALDATLGVVGDWRGLYGGGEAFGEAPVSYEFGLENHELFLTAVSHDTPLVATAAVAISLLAVVAMLVVADLGQALVVLPVLAPVTIGLSLLVWVFGLANVAVTYGNFRTRRRGSRIEVERGLLARGFSGIDVERVQSVEVRQSFVRHLMGYCELSLGRIDTAADENSGTSTSKMNAKGLVIHPFVKVDRVDEILDALVPEFSSRPVLAEAKPLPRVALRRSILRRCVWYNWLLWMLVAFAALAGVSVGVAESIGTIHESALVQMKSFFASGCTLLGVVTALFTAARALGAVWWARRSRYSWNKGYVLLYNDGLSTQTSIVPRGKIQSGATRDNPFQRRLDLTGIRAVTAAGTRSTTAALLDVPAAAGQAFLEWLKPGRSDRPCE